MTFGLGAMPQQMRLEDLARLFDPAMFGGPQAFAGTSGTVEPPGGPQQAGPPAGIAALFNPALMGAQQGFSGTSGQVVEPPAPPLQVRVRSPQSMFEQPARPPVAPSSMRPAPPQAGGPVAADFVPPPMPPQEAPRGGGLGFGGSRPPPAPEPETTGSTRQGGGSSFLDLLNKPQIYNTLLGLGSGLLSAPNMSQGFAAGIGNAATLNRQQAIADLAQAEQRLKEQKLRQEQMARAGSASVLMRSNPGLSPVEALSLAGNEALVAKGAERMADPNAGRKVLTDSQGVQRYQDTGEAVFKDDRAKRNIQLLNRPDGSVIAIDKNALDEGGGAGAAGTTVLPPAPNKISADVQARQDEVVRMGGDPKDPRNQSYILTGTMPKETQGAITAPEKQAIFKAEDAIPPINSAIDSLKRAKELNSQAFDGYTAGIRAMVGSNLPDGVVPDRFADPKRAEASREFNQLMSQQAIQSMADTLAGATTDREMATFVEILGSPSTPQNIRARTIDRMLELAERKKELAASRVEELRGGTYYKPRDADGIGRAPAQPKTAEDFAKLRSGDEFIAPDGTRRIKP